MVSLEIDPPYLVTLVSGPALCAMMATEMAMTLEREDWMPSEMPASRAECEVHGETGEEKEEAASVYECTL